MWFRETDEFLHPHFAFQSSPVLQSHCNSAFIWSSLLHFTTTTWIPTRCFIQNAAMISHQTCPFFALLGSPPHPLTCSRWKLRISHSVTFPSSSAPHLMHHSVPTTLPLKRISNTFTLPSFSATTSIRPSSVLDHPSHSNSFLVCFLFPSCHFQSTRQPRNLFKMPGP